MTYSSPSKSGFTIYGITGCKYCDAAKILAKKSNKKVKVINCDKYIERLRDRDAFYAYIHKYTKIPYTHFPMIFCDGKFIGGYKELMGTKA